MDLAGDRYNDKLSYDCFLSMLLAYDLSMPLSDRRVIVHQMIATDAQLTLTADETFCNTLCIVISAVRFYYQGIFPLPSSHFDVKLHLGNS